jgi:hypothetical protein
MSLKDQKNYNSFLLKARGEGWRSPEEVFRLEKEAYHAGMRAERTRVASIFKDVDETRPMRAMDMWKYINRINNKEV